MRDKEYRGDRSFVHWLTCQCSLAQAEASSLTAALLPTWLSGTQRLLQPHLNVTLRRPYYYSAQFLHDWVLPWDLVLVFHIYIYALLFSHIALIGIDGDNHSSCQYSLKEPEFLTVLYFHNTVDSKQHAPTDVISDTRARGSPHANPSYMKIFEIC